MNNRWLFLKQFVIAPRYLGSITPSSGYLVNRLVGLSRVSEVQHIVELGPGTGPFTVELLRRMRPDARLLCIERDPELSDHLRTTYRDPRLNIETGDAADLPTYVKTHGFPDQLPLVISGLPFTSLPDSVRDSILSSIVTSLSPQGQFLLYQYSFAMRKRLRRHFRRVETSWEVRNVPPAVCMRCTL